MLLTATEKQEKQINNNVLCNALDKAQSSVEHKAVLTGDQLEMSVATFLQKAFVVAGTDMKHKRLSVQEVTMCNENTVVLISKNVISLSDLVMTRIDVMNYGFS